MSQRSNSQTADAFVVDDDTGPTMQTRPTVDLAPCNFSGTFRHPCFWILLGVVATLGFQYVMSGRSKGGLS